MAGQGPGTARPGPLAVPLSRFAQRCGADGPQRDAACERLLGRVAAEGLKSIRVCWADLHGQLRSKSLTPAALADALHDGVGMVSTLMLKDSADRTALPVFDPSAATRLPLGAQAGNLRWLPDPSSLVPLPWAPGVAWLRGDLHADDGTPVALDPRRILARQVEDLASAGWRLVCGLEVEFHVYRRLDHDAGAPSRRADGTRGLFEHQDPKASAWPPPSPAGALALCHPGYQLLGDDLADTLEPVFELIREVADGLQLELLSLEVELGPSQVEAVFAPCDAMLAADRMIAFRHGVCQALARRGYLATFICQPPFAGSVASGWHLHQSLVRLPGRVAATGEDGTPASGQRQGLAEQRLGREGAAWLAGLLAHARGMTALASPTLSGFARFQGGAMSPLRSVWGLDNRGAMLRVVGGHASAPASGHIENRLGEPAANPYLYIATQIAAGLDGLRRGLAPPPPCTDPYARADDAPPTDRLPRTLDEALAALEQDPVWSDALGEGFVALFTTIKRAESARHQAAEDRVEWMRREYLGRL